ncbi:porin [Xylophilus sp.]|uniref:porin n=1 Tax=Xylophilus sp. TaxID=2653893 RepID=UPI0013B9917E|nr:porin [Xylophilus sp.]KAF1047501.1 MAG: Outer membrane porin protein 32 [Xylophilus sp.]
MHRSRLTFLLCASAPLFAQAQSPVAIFGVVDAGAGRISTTGTGHASGLLTGGNGTSRLGFRGSEDLGSGYSAGFHLEGELQTDTGNANGLNFMRRSTVSLSGPMGEIRMGRDFAPSYLSMSLYDVYGQRGFGFVENYGPTAGVMTSGGSTFSYIRTSNSVAYFLPAGALNGTVQYAFGERNSQTATTAANSSKQGNYMGGRLGYASGRLDVGASYGVFHDVSWAAAYVADYTVANVGGSYNFGVVKLLVLVQSESMSGRAGQAGFRFNTYSLGASMPVGGGVVRANCSRYDNKTAGQSDRDARKFALGYIYHLSRRTALYADVARVSNSGAAAFGIGNIGGSISGAAAVPVAGGRATGYAAGLRHIF